MIIQPERTAVEIVGRFPGTRVLVIGDAMLDTYLEGEATRICKEAPVPVVARQTEERCAGGAANTAANLAALGAEVFYVGLVGDDATGASLCEALREARVESRWLVTDPDVTTLHKLRVLANDQYLVRFDEGGTAACSSDGRAALLARIEELYPRCDLVVLSDYAYGTVTDEVIDTIRRLRARRPVVLAVDAKDVRRYAGADATIVTPNLQEARAVAGLGDDAAPEAIADRLRAILDTEQIAITMAGGGVLLVDPDGHRVTLPTCHVAHAGDVGAGDSFTSAMALALAHGATAPLAARIGIDAASIAITKRRTAVVTHRELLRRVSLNEQNGPFASLSLKEIATLLDAERFAGRRIVFTNGVFDILHAGHVQLLRRAKELGDILVVGVNSDASVRRLKGSQRPINHERDRLALVAALDAVDYALIFTEDTPAETIRALRPHIHVKGGDYTPDALPERDAVREVGARVEILPLMDGLSTTNVINKIMELARRDLVGSAS